MQCKGLHDITIQSLFSSYFWAIKAAKPQVGSQRVDLRTPQYYSPRLARRSNYRYLIAKVIMRFFCVIMGLKLFIDKNILNRLFHYIML